MTTTLDMRPHMIESEVDKLVAAGESDLERTFFVHRCILGTVPYFQAEQNWPTRSSRDLSSVHICKCRLPIHCDHSGCALLLCRLYAKRSWPVPEWLRDGPMASIGAAFLADMWDVTSIAAEAWAAVRVASWDPKVATIVGGLIPSSFEVSSKKPAAVRMSKESVAAMIEEACNATSSTAAKQRDVVKLMLQRRREYGKDDFQPLIAALAGCVKTKADKMESGVSNSGKTQYVYYKVERKIASEGLELLVQVMHETVNMQPDRFAEASKALLQLKVTMHGQIVLLSTSSSYPFVKLVRQRKDELSIDECSIEALDSAMNSMIQAGVNLVRSGHLSNTEYGKFLLNCPHSLVSPIALQHLAEEDQLTLINKCMVEEGIDWFVPDRLHALHGEAVAVAATSLATKLSKLDPVVMEVVSEMLLR